MSNDTFHLTNIEHTLEHINLLLKHAAARLERGWLPGKKVEYRYETWDSLLQRTELRRETGVFLAFVTVRDPDEKLYVMIQAVRGNILQVQPGFVRFLEEDELDKQILGLESQVKELKALLYPDVL